MAAAFWNDKKTSILRKLWEKTSAKDIADIIGSSRNSVIAKARRMGLAHKRRGRKCDDKKEERIIPAPIKISKFLGWKYDKINTSTIELIYAGHNQCKWPVVGEGYPYYCCGNKTLDGKQYCIDHCRRAYARTSQLTEKYIERSVYLSYNQTEKEE